MYCSESISSDTVSLRGKHKEQLGDANESNEQLKDIQENIAKMLSMLTKTIILLQYVVKKYRFARKDSRVYRVRQTHTRCAHERTRQQHFVFGKQVCKL